MAWGQQTKVSNCKDCNQSFTSKMVFGEFTKRCDACKVIAGTKMWVRPAHYFDPSYGLNRPCSGALDGIH